MVRADWGVDTEPFRVRGSADAAFAAVDADDPWEVPAVRAAAEQGFEPAPEAPIWSFLPAIWPPEERAWVPDTRVRHWQGSCQGEPLRRVPWPTVTYFEMEEEANGLLAQCGVPARPAGRLWLLKPPPTFSSLGVALASFSRSADDAGIAVMASREFVARVRREVGARFAARS
jgi:hypothetical protein